MKISSLLLTTLLLFHSNLWSHFTFDQLENEMTEEERKLSGIEKLDANERLVIEEWLAKQDRLYHIAIPTVDDVRKIGWMYEIEQIKSGPIAQKNFAKKALCIAFSNAADELVPWLEEQKQQGVDRFYLYNVQSSDNYLDVLIPYIEQGMVELIEWPRPTVDEAEIKQDCLRRATRDERHITFILGCAWQ